MGCGDAIIGSGDGWLVIDVRAEDKEVGSAATMDAAVRTLRKEKPGEKAAIDPLSPRTFILRGDLEMSIVFDGQASNTLEFGFRPELARSIKAELKFPINHVVTESNVFDDVRDTEQTSRCGQCHIAEVRREFPGFPMGVYESDVIGPSPFDEVPLETMLAEAESCDPVAQPYRCELISAVFGHGEVVPGILRDPR